MRHTIKLGQHHAVEVINSGRFVHLKFTCAGQTLHADVLDFERAGAFAAALVIASEHAEKVATFLENGIAPPDMRPAIGLPVGAPA